MPLLSVEFFGMKGKHHAAECSGTTWLNRISYREILKIRPDAHAYS